jgi:hypothetical protein
MFIVIYSIEEAHLGIKREMGETLRDNRPRVNS